MPSGYMTLPCRTPTQYAVVREASIVHRVREGCDTMSRWMNVPLGFNMLWIICEGLE